MISIRSFCYAGNCHDNRMEFCQDQTAVVKGKERCTIVLCDGAGGSRNGKAAARLVADAIGSFMQDNFNNSLSGYVPDILRKTVQVINHTLLSYAEQHSIVPGELATTVMAVTMDNQGRFSGIHLGDGNILWQVKGEEGIQEISRPQNGLRPDTTFLTMNCPMFQYLRFFRWKKPEAKRIMLLTDGMDILKNQLTEDLFDAGNQEKLENIVKRKDPFDDCSYILMELVDRNQSAEQHKDKTIVLY